MGNTRIPGARISGGARRHPLRIGVPITALALAAFASGAAQADAAPSAASHTFTAVGSLATVPAGAKAAVAPSDSTKINVDVALEPRNVAELGTYANLVSNPNSRFYKQFLTKRQTQLLFAPSQSQVDAVRAALTAAGLKPGRSIDDNLFVPVTATVGQLKRAFKIGFAGYKLADGETVFNATSPPKLDGSVASDVRGVIGLDNFVKLSDDHHAVTDSRGKMASVAALSQAAGKTSASGSAPAMCSSFTTAIDSYLAQEGYSGQDGGTYYSPTAMAGAYGYSAQLNAGDQGQGVTVAVEEWEAVNEQSVSDYISCVGAHNVVSYDTSAAGAPVQPTATNSVGTEASLDIEAIASIAPQASIIDYEGPDITASTTSADLLDTFAAPVAADSANVISLSWGSCEQGAIDTNLQNEQTTTLQLAAVQGQSFFVSSGDNGSEGCNFEGNDPTLSVDDPADNDYITAVGGTYMQGLTNPTVTPWNDSDVEGGATGGGLSIWQSLSGTANYQAGFVGPGYSNVCGATDGSTCRQVPDVSALADRRSGFPQMYYADSTGDYVMVDSGTSLAAPIMAGITALADSSTGCAVNGPAGFVNPTLYNLARNPTTYANDFQDETTGNNAYSPSGYTGSLYQAGTGYDMASGLGSPKAATLIPALCGGNTQTSGSIFGQGELGKAGQHGQASDSKAISNEANEESSR